MMELDEEVAQCNSGESSRSGRRVTIMSADDSVVECVARESTRKNRKERSSAANRPTGRGERSSVATRSTRAETASVASRSTIIRKRLSGIVERNDPHYNPELQEEQRRIAPLLARRAYHLPGNSWCDDWSQYMTNNHPLLGMCCHHRHHPIAVHQRVVCLIGSIAFGLAATNLVYLYFHFNENVSADEPILEIHFNTNHTFIDDGKENSRLDRYSHLTLTNGMVALWTVGGAFHSIFDLTVWYITACSCCHPGGMFDCIGCCRSVGSYAVIIVVAAVVSFATFVVVLRATVDTSLHDDGEDTGEHPLTNLNGLGSLSFLVGYLIEMGLAMFVYYPLIGTIFFSGVLGCGRLPFLGGRPREMRRERQNRNRDEESCGSIGEDTFEDEDTIENTLTTGGPSSANWAAN